MTKVGRTPSSAPRGIFQLAPATGSGGPISSNIIADMVAVHVYEQYGLGLALYLMDEWGELVSVGKIGTQVE